MFPKSIWLFMLPDHLESWDELWEIEMLWFYWSLKLNNNPPDLIFKECIYKYTLMFLQNNWVSKLLIYKIFGTRSRYLEFDDKLHPTEYWELWDSITYPCTNYLLLAPKSSNNPIIFKWMRKYLPHSCHFYINKMTPTYLAYLKVV